MPTYTSLKGLSDISKKQSSEILEDNLINLLDWSFLQVGAYSNVYIQSSGAYGGSRAQLGPLDHPSYNDGQVWQTQRGHWVWESGFGIDISGVYVNNTLYGTGDATYSHHYDYMNGRVIFDTAIPTTSTVKMEYSYKWIQVEPVYKISFLRSNYFSHRPDRSNIDLFGSGEYDKLNRVDFPILAVEVPPKASTRPYELGSGARWARNRILLRVLGVDKTEPTRIADILADQHNKTFYLFDSNEVIASGALPLDHRGMLIDNTKTYPELVKVNAEGGYLWNKLYIDSAHTTNSQQLSQDLYLADVMWETDIILTQV